MCNVEFNTSTGQRGLLVYIAIRKSNGTTKATNRHVSLDVAQDGSTDTISSQINNQ